MPRLNSDHFCRHTDHFLRPIRVEVSIISVSTQTRHAADTVLSRKTFVWGHFLFLPGGSLPSYCTMHHFYEYQTCRHTVVLSGKTFAWEHFLFLPGGILPLLALEQSIAHCVQTVFPQSIMVSSSAVARPAHSLHQSCLGGGCEFCHLIGETFAT